MNLHFLFYLFSTLASVWIAMGCEKTCNVTFVTREEWNSSVPLPTTMIPPVELVFIHHTAMPFCTTEEECVKNVQDIQTLHVKHNGWDDIGYSFLIGGDGRVYIGRGWDRQGAHTYGYNVKGIGIALLGNFNERRPTENMLTAAKNLIKCGLDLGKILPDYGLYGHRDGRCTECPGDMLYEIIKKWDHYGEAGKLKIFC